MKRQEADMSKGPNAADVDAHSDASAPLEVLSTVYPTSPPLEEVVERFWETGPEFDSVEVDIRPPEDPLALLERLGPSPFERGGFPLIGFLATTYDKVSRYGLERR